MPKLKRPLLLALASAATMLPASAGAAIVGPDAAACRAHAGAAALVRVTGFKQRTGRLRVQLYGSDPDAFLAKGQYLKRIDLPVAPGGAAMDVCVALPHPGEYAIAVRHDLNGSGKSDWNDGGGFSRNPHLSLFDLKPHYDEVALTFGAAPRIVDVVLNYRRGLSIGPVASN